MRLYVDLLDISQEQEITHAMLDLFQQLNPQGQGHIYTAHRSPFELYNGLAALLAHPMQRPPLSRVNHNIEVRPDACCGLCLVNARSKTREGVG